MVHFQDGASWSCSCQLVARGPGSSSCRPLLTVPGVGSWYGGWLLRVDEFQTEQETTVPLRTLSLKSHGISSVLSYLLATSAGVCVCV